MSKEPIGAEDSRLVEELILEPRSLNSGFLAEPKQWQPTPVFLPGESQGRGSLVGCHLWCRTELDTTEVT